MNWPKIDWSKIKEPVELIENSPEANMWWILDNHIYGTGKYKEIIKQLNDEKGPDKEEFQ